jgi:hypothetical protein
MVNNQKSRILKIMQVLVLTIPAIIYFVVLNKYALNIPAQDDYDAILHFIHYYSEAHGISKFFSLFTPHGEHRILSSRLIYVACHNIFGEINFRSIILIGNLQLVGIFVILVSFIKKKLPGNWLVLGFLASTSLFDLIHWENADFAMASVQNYGVIFLFLLSLWLYTLSNRWAVILAIIVQIVCTYSSGNGIIAAAFLALFNMTSVHKFRKYASLTTFVIFVPLYFLNYQSPATSHPSTDVAAVGVYFFCFLGNYVYYEKIVVFIIGLIICAGFLLSIPYSKRLFKDTPLFIFVCFAGFLLTTMLVGALFRSAPGAYIASRYLVYPHLFMIVLFVFLMQRVSNLKLRRVVESACILVALLGYLKNFHDGEFGLKGRREALETNDYYYPDKNGAKNIAKESCDSKVYCIEKHRAER